PQFVDPARGSVLGQFLIFGLILNIGGTIINCLVGGFAGKLGAVLSRSAKIARGFQIFTGCVFLGLAAKLAFDKR
ncbi:MAG: LysE family translocator, partial [Pseudomonadales bacterium]